MGILPMSILIFAIVIFLYALFRFVEDHNLKHIAKEHEMHAIHCWEKIVKNPHHINIVREKKAIRIMRKRYLQLKYKFKNDPKILADIAKDWQDYVHAIHEFISEKEVFEIDFGNRGGESDAVWRFKKRVASQIIRKDQIEGRFCRLLGISDMSMPHMELDTDIYKRKE